MTRRILHIAASISVRRSRQVWIVSTRPGHWLAVLHCHPGAHLICRVIGAEVVR